MKSVERLNRIASELNELTADLESDLHPELIELLDDAHSNIGLVSRSIEAL